VDRTSDQVTVLAFRAHAADNHPRGGMSRAGGAGRARELELAAVAALGVEGSGISYAGSRWQAQGSRMKDGQGMAGHTRLETTRGDWRQPRQEAPRQEAPRPASQAGRTVLSVGRAVRVKLGNDRGTVLRAMTARGGIQEGRRSVLRAMTAGREIIMPSSKRRPQRATQYRAGSASFKNSPEGIGKGSLASVRRVAPLL
jgi:hypothetical protein